MFDRAPKEPEALSWGYAVFWAGLTFVTVPYVREGVKVVREHLGSGFFTYAVAACAVLAAVAALYATRQRWSLASCAWLLGLAGLVVYLSFDLAAGNAEEAIHYVQYGTLSLLLFRAFSHRIRDYSIYPAATLVGTLAGMIDETVQWLTPGRVFDLRDVWLNFKAVALVQIGLAAGVRPRLISGWPGLEGVKRLCYLGALTLGYLGLCLQNTPDRVSSYSAFVPGLGFIDPSQSVMVEYGYLHGDADSVFFRSRLSKEAMRRAAAIHADDGALNFDDYHERERHEYFWDIYSPVTDPYLYEARIHQLRRDAYLRRATSGEESDKQVQHFTTAYWENLILKENFGGLLRGSSFEWSAERDADVRAAADLTQPHESGVSRHLIIAWSPRQLAFMFAGGVIVLLLGAYFCGRASRQVAAS